MGTNSTGKDHGFPERQQKGGSYYANGKMDRPIGLSFDT
jgi:hypothetical protein